VLSTIQRVGVDQAPRILTMDAQGRISLGASLEDAESARIDNEIWATLANGPRTEADIRDDVPARSGVVGRSLRRLVKRGRVVRTGKGRKGDAYLYGRDDAQTTPEGGDEKPAASGDEHSRETDHGAMSDRDVNSSSWSPYSAGTSISPSPESAVVVSPEPENASPRIVSRPARPENSETDTPSTPGTRIEPGKHDTNSRSRGASCADSRGQNTRPLDFKADSEPVSVDPDEVPVW
jgi:hypothetical protein